MARIAYLGNFAHRHCTEVHLAATLESLGHTVFRLQENATPLPEIEMVGAQSDLVLYTRTWGLPAEATEIWRRLEAKGVATASYHLDLYLGLVREATLQGDPFWSTQFVFTPDGDPASAVEFERRGVNHHYIRPGVYKPECRMGRPSSKFRHPVAFVGSYPYPHPEWTYRNEMIEFLKATYGAGLGVYPGRGPAIRNEDLNDLYASTRVVVGDSLCLGFTKPYYWSDRPYETVGRGGFLIMPRVPGLDEDFCDGKHLRFYDFGDFDGLKALVDHYVAHPEEGRAIALEGQAHVREHLTYTERLSQALAIMGM